MIATVKSSKMQQQYTKADFYLSNIFLTAFQRATTQMRESIFHMNDFVIYLDMYNSEYHSVAPANDFVTSHNRFRGKFPEVQMKGVARKSFLENNLTSGTAEQFLD